MNITMNRTTSQSWKAFLKRKYADLVKESIDRGNQYPKTAFAKLLGVPNSTLATWMDESKPMESVDWAYIARAYELWGDEFLEAMGLTKKELSRA